MAKFVEKWPVQARRFLGLLALLLLAACAAPEDRAENYYQRGMKLLAEKDYARASIELKNALQLKDNLVGAWMGLAQIEERNRNWEGLGAVLRKLAELQPKEVEPKLRLARLMLLGNALDEALNLANAAIELDGGHAGIRALKGAVLLRLRDGAGAIREAQAALDADPQNAEAVVVLAAEQLSRGDAQGALRTLERDSVAQLNDFGINLFRIRIFEQLGDFGQVEALIRKLIGLYPQEAVFRRQLVRLYMDQKRPDDAEKELRSLAGANPSDAEATLDLVRFLRAVRGVAAARAELMNRINAGGQVFRYQIALAELHFAEGNYADSVNLLEGIIGTTSSREQAIQAQIKLAEMHLAKKRTEAAEAIINEVLRKDARNVGALRLRASIRLDGGQLEGAIADLRQALNDQPQATDLLNLLAVAYERSGSIELADKQFADATRASNFDPDAGLNYVAFLRRRGSIAHAEDVLTELASRTPGHIAVLSALAEIRLARQNWAGAQDVAESIRRLGGDGNLADQIQGAALFGRNRHEESIAVLQNAHAAAPNAVQPMFALVRALVRSQKVDRAETFLNAVLQSNPANAEAHVLLGSIHLLRKAADRAERSFRLAIERQPKNVIGYRALADLHLGQQKTADALKVVRAGLEQEPTSFALRLVLAGILEQNGDIEAAIAEYETMLKEQPGSLIVTNNLVSLLSDHRSDKASLERAYTLSGTLRKSPVPHFKDTVGWMHYLRGDHRAALSLLEEAATELPDVALVRYHLGMAYVATGQNEKASEQLKKAVQLAGANGALGEKIRSALKKAGLS